jgi:arabinose-5-phosphate isomerase
MSAALDEITRVLELEGGAILACAERWRADPRCAEAAERALAHLQAALDGGGKIVVTGVGKSGKIAQKIAATLCSTGSLAVFLHPTEGLHGDLGLVSPNDAVLALSYSGNTDELVRLLPSIRSLRVPVIGLGGRRESQLAESCDVWLDAAVAQEACPHNLAPTSSTTLALALGDALAVALMQRRGFDASAFARNHPGGALGSRLHLRVEDLMHRGDAVPRLGPNASMDEVVMSASQGRLGAVLVAEGPRLLGLITDGDLRRALQHRERFFTMRASEIMTRGPITIEPEARALEALERMENRPSQISVLPVVRAGTDEWVGIVRLHDLVRSL